MSGRAATIVGMSNPATLLANMLDQWGLTGGHTIASTRRQWAGSEGSVGDDEELWAAHRTAVEHLQEIDDALSSMETLGTDMSFYRAQMPRWHAFTFGVAYGWDTPVPNDYRLEADSLGLLKALGHMLDATDYAPELSPSARDDLIETLRESRDLVMEAQFPKPLAQTLLGLLREAEDAVVDYEVAGSVKVRSTALKASSAMMMASTDASITNDPKKVGKFRSAAGSIVMTIAVTSGSNVATDAMQELFHMKEQHSIEAPKPKAIEAPVQDQVDAAGTVDATDSNDSSLT